MNIGDGMLKREIYLERILSFTVKTSKTYIDKQLLVFEMLSNNNNFN